MTVSETLANYDNLPPDVQKHLEALEEYIGHTDGKSVVTWAPAPENSCVDDGVIDSSEAVTAFNGIVAALTAALSGQAGEKELTLVRSQLSECHKEIFKLREALLADPPPSSTAGEG